MKKLLLLSLFAFLLTACTTSKPLYNANTEIPVNNVSSPVIQDSILKALEFKRWVVEKKSDGLVIASINVRSHRARIKITYDQKSYQINYMDSTNLDYRVKKMRVVTRDYVGESNKGVAHIHRNYNKWIQLLDNEIKTYIIRAS